MSTQQHRYAYDKAVPGHPAKKFKCPQCGHKRYVQFYDFQNNQYLPEHFGKCDREDNCGYVNTPWQWLKEQGQADAEHYRITVAYTEPVKARIIEIDKSILKATLVQYESNNFIRYLLSFMEEAVVEALIARYFIGTAKNNGTIFWQLDQLYRIRTAQKIHYKLDGHRNKSINPPSQRLFTVDKGYIPCLFGEHLIYDAPKNAYFAVCEAEKTAVICSVYFPSYNNRPLYWLACCGMHGFTDDKFDALAGQDVILCNDFAFTARATWGSVPMRKKFNSVSGKMEVASDGDIITDYVSVKMKLEQRGCSVRFFDPYPEIEDGSDLADYVVQNPVPMSYEMPDLPSLALPAEVIFHRNEENAPQKLDLLSIGQAIEERDQKTQKNYNQLASSMIYERYGYGVGSGKFDIALPKLAGQLKLLDDPRVQELQKRFNLEPELKF